MAKNRPYKILSRIVEIKKGEKNISILLFFYFFLIMAPYYIIKPVRDAQYLIVNGSNQLPIAYLLTALIMLFFVSFYSKIQFKVPRHILIPSSLIFFISTSLLSGLFFIKGFHWMPLVFWIWANIFVVVLVTQFWILVNDIFNPREAKRLIGFFGSGGILGGVFGGLMTGFLGFNYSDYLLFIAAGMLIISVFIVNYIFIWQRKRISTEDEDEKKDDENREGTAKVGFKDCFDTVKKNYYLKLLAAVVTITFIVSTLIDWQYKSVIDFEIHANYKQTFFGYFHAAMLVIPFFVQLLMTSSLIRRFGIRFALLVYPLILLICSLGIAAYPGVILAVIIKGSDKSLSFSLNQSVRELLYIPISSKFKYKAKIFIDMFLNRFAKGIGALILLIFIFLNLNWDTRVQVVSAIIVVFILAWTFFNLKISKEYTNTVKKKLEMKWERADRSVTEKVDLNYTKLVFDTLESKNRSSVLYAMNLLDLIKQNKLTPEVKKLISYKSDEVRVSSLGMLFENGETSLVPETDDYIREEVLGKEVKEIMSLDVYQKLMEGYFEKVLVDESTKAETAKMEAAKAIGLMESHSPLTQKLEEFLRDESPEVSRYAIESAAKLQKREHVSALIQKLYSPFTRQEASAALEKYGSRVTGTLADYVGDSEEDIELRKGATSVLANIGTQEAADFLTWVLKEDRGDIDIELIDALDKIRSERPDIQFQKGIVKTKIAELIKKHIQTLIDFYDSKSMERKQEMSENLSKDLEISLMNIFKLLGLIYPHKDIHKAYQNIRVGTKELMAYAEELLDNILQKEIKDLIFPLIEKLPIEERVKRYRTLLKGFQIL
jgi:ATP:ADP antiporter, AAA family